MSIWSRALFAVALALGSVNASAEKAVVVYSELTCDYLIAGSNLGFVFLEWCGGYTPSQGDLIVGKFITFGMESIYDITADQEVHIWIEDFRLSKDDVVKQYVDQCN